MTKQGIKRQSVIVDDLLISQLRDRVYAERLTRDCGVRLHFGIAWSDMRYYTHYRSPNLDGEIWEFSSKPFKELSND